MFALICELPSSLCGWSRLINNNSSWRRRNNSPKNKKRLWIKTRCKERDRRRRNGRFLSADWSFVTQIGADEVQRRMTVPATTTHGFVSWRPAALMWATSSALIQEVTAAGREGSPDTTGLKEEDKTWTLERWSGRDSYSCKHQACTVAVEIMECYQVQHRLLGAMLEVSSQCSLTKRPPVVLIRKCQALTVSLLVQLRDGIIKHCFW